MIGKSYHLFYLSFNIYIDNIYKMKLQEQINRIQEMMKLNLNEVSDEIYDKIEKEYSNSKLVMTSDENLEFKYYGEINSVPIGVQEVGNKPKGIWYGIGTSWIDWVRIEMPHWEKENVFKIELDESKILFITNEDELYSFNKQFGVENSKRCAIWQYKNFIDWQEVAKIYDGIEISPYDWDGRNKYCWYYPWDVEGGCIWGKNVIKNIEKIRI